MKAAPAASPPLLLTPAMAARELSLNVQTLSNWRASGRGPAFVRLGNAAIRYRYDDLVEYASENSHTPRVKPPEERKKRHTRKPAR